MSDPAGGEVSVFNVSLSDPDIRELPFDAWLNPSETRRISRLLRDEDRQRARVARGLTRLIVGHATGQSPEEVDVLTTRHGKPHVANGPSFNVAHSGPCVLLAVATSGQVGVDVEAVRPIAQLESLVERVFAPEELAEYRALPEPERVDAFFRGWVRKEALAKATGLGLGLPLDSFAVSLASDAAPILERAPGRDTVPAGEWSVRSLLVGPGLHGAVALDRKRFRIVLRELPQPGE